MAKKISQREARRLQKQVSELQNKIGAIQRPWTNDYPGGAHIATYVHQALCDTVKVANKLGHPVVVTVRNGELYFYGVNAK